MIGLLVVVGLVLLLFFGLGILVYYSVENFMNKSDYYEAKIYNMSKEMPDWVINHMGDSGKAALSKDKLFGTLTDSAAASEVIIDVLLESEHALTTTALTMLYTVFILLGRQDRSEREKQQASAPPIHTTTRFSGMFVRPCVWCFQTLVVIEDQLQVYLSWKFVVSAVSGAVIGLTLGRLEIDLAAVFGLLTFFLNFIPTGTTQAAPITTQFQGMYLITCGFSGPAGGNSSPDPSRVPQPRVDHQQDPCGLNTIRPADGGDELR